MTAISERGSRQIAKCSICGGAQPTTFRIAEHQYCRCANCRLTSHLPFPDDATIVAYYRRKLESGNYRLLSEFAPQYQRIYRDYAARLRKVINFHQSPQILDVGCFTGDFLSILKDEGADVYGLELQEEAVRVANRRLPGRVFQARVEGTEFPQGPYDAITLMAVIEHVTEPRRLVQSCVRLLKPGGLMMLETPNTGSIICRVAGRYWPPYAPIEHLNLFSARSLRILLTDPGLRDIPVESHWKTLPVEYVYRMMQNYGPQVRKILTPLYKTAPLCIRNAALPFYAGR